MPEIIRPNPFRDTIERYATIINQFAEPRALENKRPIPFAEFDGTWMTVAFASSNLYLQTKYVRIGDCILVPRAYGISTMHEDLIPQGFTGIVETLVAERSPEVDLGKFVLRPIGHVEGGLIQFFGSSGDFGTSKHPEARQRTANIAKETLTLDKFKDVEKIEFMATK